MTPSSEEQASSRIECTAALETMSNLLKKVTLMWGTRELDKFIQSLFMDSRDGKRQGFPQPVAQELMFLAECNKMVRAMDFAKSMGLNVSEAHRMIDAGDQAAATGGSSPWNDPASSKDTVSRATAQQHKPASSPQSSVRPSSGDSGGKGIFFWIFMTIVVLVAAQFGMKYFGQLLK